MARWRDRIGLAGLVLGAAGVVLSLGAAPALSAAAGRTVQLVTTPNAPDIVEMNRMMWSKGEPVAPIYGTPIGDPAEILFIEESRIIIPVEDPSLTLYTVDKSKGENPLQMQSVRFVSRYTLIASAVLLAAGVLHFAWKRLRSKPTG